MTLIRDIGLATGDPFLLFKNKRQFECEVEGKKYDVYEFHLNEEMSEIFRAELTLVSDRPLQSSDFLGKEAKPIIKGRVSGRILHGKIRQYEVLSVQGHHHV